MVYSILPTSVDSIMEERLTIDVEREKVVGWVVRCDGRQVRAGARYGSLWYERAVQYSTVRACGLGGWVDDFLLVAE